MAGELLLLFVLILISGFFSGSEIAYVVANKIKIEIKARKKNIAAQSAYYYTQNPQKFFSTILIGNNIVNISFASISAVFLASVFSLSEFYILIISSFIILIFGELIPKYFARELADRIILLSSLPLRAITFIIYPFVKITSFIADVLTGSTSEFNRGGVASENVNLLFSKEDLEILVKESHRAGVVDKKESDIISKVLALGDQRVYEAMRPRTEIVGVEITSSVDEALLVFIESGYSKLPVYEDSLDNIKGIIYANDFFTFPASIKDILKDAIFIPETKKSLEMLNEFLSKQVSIAVVVDEFGGTAGIVTMEDIFEEMFGEIRDEYDVEEHISRKIADNAYLISGKVEIDFINEKYNLNIPEGDYETIAGYITTKIGRIPAQGENVSVDGFKILIVRADKTRIDVVRLSDNRETGAPL